MICAAPAAQGAPVPTWEEVSSPQTQVIQQLDTESQGGVDIIVHDGYIYIWSQRPVTVKLFSILGQQIHSETVQGGIHRLRLNSKGIYIIRAGQLTKRVTL